MYHEKIDEFARPNRDFLIFEYRSAAYTEICEQWSATNQKFMAGIVEFVRYPDLQ